MMFKIISVFIELIVEKNIGIQKNQMLNIKYKYTANILTVKNNLTFNNFKFVNVLAIIIIYIYKKWL